MPLLLLFRLKQHVTSCFKRLLRLRRFWEILASPLSRKTYRVLREEHRTLRRFFPLLLLFRLKQHVTSCFKRLLRLRRFWEILASPLSRKTYRVLREEHRTLRYFFCAAPRKWKSCFGYGVETVLRKNSIYR